jgi:lipid-A-disaccharide synthase
MNWSTALRRTMPPSIFISAGEASGEHYGAELARALSQISIPKGQTAEWWGMGGPRMAAAGVRLIVRAEDMAVMGLTEVVLHLPRIYREFRKLKRAIRLKPPTVAILIDFPEINFRLAREFHRLGVPVIYFVSPQLWAWKQHRIKLVREYVRRMLVIFPFEEPYYRARGVHAEFVGHPLADLPQPSITREQFAAENHLNPAREWIGLLPGSRLPEIMQNLPEMVKAAALLGDKYDSILPLAPTLTKPQIETIQRQLTAGTTSAKPPRIIFVHDARAALVHARASIVASGTATVEAALIGNPFVVVYRVSGLTYAIAKRMVSVPHVAMVNLIAQKRVVPELIQHDFTAANIAEHLKPLLPDGPARESMTIELEAVRRALGGPSARQQGQPAPGKTTIDRVAAIVVEEVERATKP